MAKKKESKNSKLLNRLLKLRKGGLEAYGKYLDKEFKRDEGKKNKRKYLKYIEKEIKDNARRIKKVDAKID
jgi:hypothetical protein